MTRYFLHSFPSYGPPVVQSYRSPMYVPQSPGPNKGGKVHLEKARTQGAALQRYQEGEKAARSKATSNTVLAWPPLQILAVFIFWNLGGENF